MTLSEQFFVYSLTGFANNQVFTVTHRSGRHTEKRTYSYIDKAKEYRPEEVTFTDGTKKVEAVAHYMIICRNLATNRLCILELDKDKAGDFECVLQK